MFESGEQVNVTEAISVEYGLSIDPRVFAFGPTGHRA